jgi:hypothetical protein
MNGGDVAKTTTAKTLSDPGVKESATQDNVPVPANTTEASVPEVQAAMGEGEPEPDDSEDAPQAKKDAAPEQKKWVVYREAQHFEIRTITPQDWAKAGVVDGKLLHWHKGNDFRVPLEDLGFLSEGQIQQYILSEPRFAIVEE